MRRTYWYSIVFSAIWIIACIVCADLALAHSLSIHSGRPRVTEGGKAPLFSTSGHDFPVDDGVRSNRLASIRVHTTAGEVKGFSSRGDTGLRSQMVPDHH